jgi:hypothetical protein
MNFEPSEKVKDLQRRVSAFMHQYWVMQASIRASFATPKAPLGNTD